MISPPICELYKTLAINKDIKIKTMQYDNSIIVYVSYINTLEDGIFSRKEHESGGLFKEERFSVEFRLDGEDARYSRF